MFIQALIGLAALLAFSPTADAQTLCTYQEYVCGARLLTDGYTPAQLRTAYDANPGPVITDDQLEQVLFRCTDTAGLVIANSYCIVACAALGTFEADQCIM
ncbi:hypothetical protein B0I35DRAFT_461494 [Stachybotrys elegans]|uniref:Uncharacterized protein n=1 Tax=Stachybotrys elegans TaxID=80388 RepID=A0A8K0STZ0_9HYPO|nr:hypothetical protein B0I35DRAFT_461494 [Stachybotrys elegans]